LQFTFHSSERLKSRKIIASLFEKGSTQTLNAYPIRFVWTVVSEQSSPIQAAFSVSKRTFKHANQRNTVKRRMREAYRLHKHLMYEHLEGKAAQYAIMFIYNGKEEMPYADIERAYQIGIKKWCKINTLV
jgi:ribonuclease P protein component